MRERSEGVSPDALWYGVSMVPKSSLFASGVSLALFLCGLSFAPGARADVPGPRDVCESEGQACETCWQHYGTSPDDEAAFAKCKEPLVAKGYTESCRNRQGAGDNVVFCAPGAAAQKVTRGGGCGGCAVSSGGAANALLGVAAGLGLLAMRRRKRPRP